MKKRDFLAAATAAVGATTLSSAALAAPAGQKLSGPGLLTVTGAIGRGNRGPIDKALDQMMAKQQITFDKAQVFDFRALTALPAVTIRPTVEYDARVHALKGPLLAGVLQAAGVNVRGRPSWCCVLSMATPSASAWRRCVSTASSSPPTWMGSPCRWVGWGPCGPCSMPIATPTWPPSRCPSASPSALGA